MRHSRREILKGLAALPLLQPSILEASTQKQKSATKGGSHPGEKESGAITLRFEGLFGYLMYPDYIEVFTPNLPDEHEYSFGMGDQYLYGFPAGDFDLRQVLPSDSNGQHQPPDKAVTLTKSQAEISSPDFKNRYWRLQLPTPSRISGVDTTTMLKDAFTGKHAQYVNQITELYLNYEFTYHVDAAASKKLHLARGRGLGMTYRVQPKITQYSHAVDAFKELTQMLPNLQLELKPGIDHPATDKGIVHTLDEYILDTHLILCTAPSVFISGM